MFSAAEAAIRGAEEAGMDTQALWESYLRAEEARDLCDHEAAWKHLDGILTTEIPEAVTPCVLLIALGLALALGPFGPCARGFQRLGGKRRGATWVGAPQ